VVERATERRKRGEPELSFEEQATLKSEQGARGPFGNGVAILRVEMPHAPPDTILADGNLLGARCMPVLFDPADEFVSSVLDRAKLEGEISLPDVEAIVEAGVEARGSIPADDIVDTIEALNRMGIEIAHDLTQKQRDEEMHCAIKEWVDRGNMVPSLTGAAWASLGRVAEREKRGEPEPTAEEAAERRKILAERTWIQTLFADFGPRICRERRGLW